MVSFESVDEDSSVFVGFDSLEKDGVERKTQFSEVFVHKVRHSSFDGVELGKAIQQLESDDLMSER